MATDDRLGARDRLVAGAERFLSANLPPGKRPPAGLQGRLLAMADELSYEGEWYLAFVLATAYTARSVGSVDALAGLCLQFCEAVGRIPGQSALAALAAPPEPQEAP